MLKITANNTLEFYKYKITFKDNGVERVDYDDVTTYIVDMVNKDPLRFTDLVIEEFQPCVKKKARLNEVTRLDLDGDWSSYFHVFNIYVEHGICTSKDPKLTELYTKAEADTKMFLLDRVKERIKDMRDQHILDGFELFGTRFDSDERAKANVTGSVAIFELVIKERVGEAALANITTPWKDYYNNFISLNLAQLKELAYTMVMHIQHSFTAESKVYAILLTKSVEALCSLEENLIFTPAGSNVVHEELTDNDLRGLLKEEYNKLMIRP